jgi:hypothetical protein
MSNPLAVAMATSALVRLIGEAVAAAGPGGVPNATVTTVRPDLLSTDGDARGVNVFLYRVSGNGHWMHADLPTRRADGTVLARPQQALDLHYLLTFSGDEADLEPQRLLGLAVSTLTGRPVLDRPLVRDAIARALADDPTTWQQFSDLADQVDTVRLHLHPLDLEELSKLWSTFFQVPYRLSVAYSATVVLLDHPLTPQPALPVRTRALAVAPLAVPAVTRVVADSAPTDPVEVGTLVRIEGRRLAGPDPVRVQFGAIELPVPPDQLTDTSLVVPVPPGVPAGVLGVQVRHQRAESVAAPLLVRPRVAGPVTAVAGDGRVEVTVPVEPPVGRGQRVQLLLAEHPPPTDRLPRAYAVPAPPADPAGPAESAQVVVPVRDAVPGDYLVRVQVDGAQSVLATGPDGAYTGPLVSLP